LRGHDQHTETYFGHRVELFAFPVYGKLHNKTPAVLIVQYTPEE